MNMFRNKPSNSEKVFKQWLQFVKEDDKLWINQQFKNLC